MFSRVCDSFLTLLYPQVCAVCRRSVERLSDGAACGDCWNQTFIYGGGETLCAKCGRFLRAQPSDFQTFCHLCDEHSYDAASAVGSYEKALAASVINLKREPHVARRLQKLFLRRLETTSFLDATRVIPVPLSKKRLMERGYNQAAVLSKILSKQFNLPLDEQSLVRAVHTPMHRVAMDSKARAASVKDVFEVARPNSIKDEIVLLVDDVFTSGATVSACAEVLKENGACRVYVLTLARAA